MYRSSTIDHRWRDPRARMPLGHAQINLVPQLSFIGSGRACCCRCGRPEINIQTGLGCLWGMHTLLPLLLFIGCLGRGLLLLLAGRSVGKKYANQAGSTALSSVHPRGDRSGSDSRN